MEQIIVTISPMLRGWFEYFSHTVKSTFTILDNSYTTSGNIKKPDAERIEECFAAGKDKKKSAGLKY